MLKYTPQEGDDIALFVRLLLGSLPLDRVAHVWSPSKKNAQVAGKRYSVWVSSTLCEIFRENLGEKPTLWKWQHCVKLFLTKWCPHGKPNDFKWKDQRGGHWTLRSAEIDGIAYHQTYQYASDLMHYDAYTSAPTNPMPSADGAMASTTTYGVSVGLSESD